MFIAPCGVAWSFNCPSARVGEGIYVEMWDGDLMYDLLGQCHITKVMGFHTIICNSSKGYIAFKYDMS